MAETDFLKLLRKILVKYSYAEAATLLEVSSKSISNYLSGQNPHPKTFRKAEEVIKSMENERKDVIRTDPNKAAVKGAAPEEPDFDYKKLISIIASQNDTIRSQQETIKTLVDNRGNANGRHAVSA